MKVHDRWTVTLMLTLVLSFASAGAAGSTGPHLPAALPAHGSCGADRVTVEPAAPTYRDPIRVTASGVWCDGCTPKFRSGRRDGNVIEVHGLSVGADPGICAAKNGGTHMALEDMGILRTLPGTMASLV